jgi:prepilin-type N-terminal cleavage/methylation domain-containing protein
MQSLALGRSRRPVRRAPAAFTLLELLIAIAIIGILASLILTVAGSANIKARNTQISVDIQDLSKGVAAFKQRFTVEPPSRITLYEQAAGWSNDPRSMGIIRQIWPQFDFTYAAEGGQIDINGDGKFTGDGYTNTTTGAIALSGSECLVFFLGGVPATLNQIPGTPSSPLVFGGAPAGFSLNPADPFGVTFNTSNTPPRTVVGTNRERFTEFDVSRLFLLKPPVAPNQHSMNSYMDTLPGQQQPYFYLSSYGGQGYDVANELPAGPVGNQTFIDVYRTGPVTFQMATATNPPSPAWNANSFQIISPGGDQLYGVGGQYQAGDPNGLLVGARSAERDNITNFSSSTLAP